MRTFTDDGGATWVASVRERLGADYKGRFLFVLTLQEGHGEKPIELVDVSWNSLKTAERTLRTMSTTELKRRHRSALGRSN